MAAAAVVQQPPASDTAQHTQHTQPTYDTPPQQSQGEVAIPSSFPYIPCSPTEFIKAS